jgi:hypothetical protein
MDEDPNAPFPKQIPSSRLRMMMTEQIFIDSVFQASSVATGQLLRVVTFKGKYNGPKRFPEHAVCE